MAVDFSLLVLRVVIGLILAAHGSMKLFGWFSSPGLKYFSGVTKRMGLRPPLFWALLAALGEFGGGLLVTLGLLTPLGALGMMGAMFFAMVKVHWSKGFWNSKGGSDAAGVGCGHPGKQASSGSCAADARATGSASRTAREPTSAVRSVG